MKSLLKRYLFAFLWLAVIQTATAEQGVLVVHQTPGAVHLRWNAPLGSGYEGFVVERRPVGGTWQRVTPEPIRPVTDVERIREILGPAADAYLGFFGNPAKRIDAETFRKVTGDEIARSFLQLLSVKNPLIGEVLGEIHHDRDLHPGKAFDYRVLILQGGTSRPWAATTRPVRHGEPDRLPVPKGFRGEGGDASALLDWNADPELSRSGQQVGFRVYRAISPTGPFEPASFDTVIPVTIDGKRPEHLFVDSGLENGRPYWYRITGVNVLGYEGPPTQAIKVVPRDATPPPPPRGLHVSLLGGDALLRWRPVRVDDLEGYRVYRSTTTSGPWKRIWPEKDEPLLPRITFRDRKVPEGAQFWYQVTAVDTSGNESRPSPAVQLYRPDVTPPAQVQGVKAVARDKGKDKGILITWKPNREQDLLGYLVERTTTIEGKGSKAHVTGKFFSLHSEPLREPRYLDPVPPSSQSRYAYRIVAVDRAWNRSKPSKTVIARMPDRVPPQAPNLLRLTQTPKGVRLEWTPNVEEDLAGYRIERSEAGGRFLPLTKGKPIAVDARNFVDTRVKSGRIYRYRLIALDEAGNRSRPSTTLSIRVLDLEAPEPPAIRRIVQKQDGLEIHWRPSKDRDIKRQILYRRRGKEHPVILADLKPNVGRYLDRRVEAGETYTYFIRVADAVDNLSEPGKSRTAKHSPRGRR